MEALYLRLPIAAQNVATSLEGFRIRRARFSPSFTDHLRRAESRLTCSTDEFIAYRDERLTSFICHCYDTVPYYRKLFDACRIDAREIRTLTDLRAVPVLNKGTVQEQYTEFLSQSVPVRERIVTHTSGTTGGGLRFATTQSALDEQWSIWWRFRHLHGLRLHTWCAYFGGRSVVPLTQKRPPYWRYNLPGRQILFSAYHMSATTLSYYISELRRQRPIWLHGYPSLLALVAGFILEHDVQLGYQPTWVTTAAENLLPQQAALIERAFGTRPIQHYGMVEAVANFSECLNGRLHVDEDLAGVEFLPLDGGKEFRIIGTNFTNLATPLVRYEVGDNVELDDSPCDCGLPGRIVKQVDGRKEDYIVLRNGARLGRLDHVFKDLVCIREAQILQEIPGEVLIRIVRGDNYTPADEDMLLMEFRKRVGDDTTTRVVYVDQLERSSSGKLRFVVSKLKQGTLEQV